MDLQWYDPKMSLIVGFRIDLGRLPFDYLQCYGMAMEENWPKKGSINLVLTLTDDWGFFDSGRGRISYCLTIL